MKLLISFLFAGIVASQEYGVPPQTYPSAPVNPGYPPYYHQYSSSSSSSSSEEHERCHYCKNLKHYDDKSISTFRRADIFYVHGRHGCKLAIVNCPFDKNTYALFGINSENRNSAIGNGTFVQRAIKCNRHGKWQADAFEKYDYHFKSVVCQIQLPVSDPDKK